MVCVVSVGVLLALPTASRGDDADDIVAGILRSTPNQAEAARKILDAAKAMPDAPAVQIRLCEEAYKQGAAAVGGFPAALGALDLLEKIAPSRAEWTRVKRLDVHRLQYYRSTGGTKAANGRRYVDLLLARARATGKGGNWTEAANCYRQAYTVARTVKLSDTDAIYDSLRTAGHYEMIHNRVGKLKNALASNPDDLFSRTQLINAHLVDLDQPHEAAKYLSPKVDPALSRNVTRAATKASGLTEADFLALGTWYRSLAGRAPLKHTKVRMLTRALNHMNRYLEVYTKQDARRLRATTLVKAIEAELKRLGAEVAVRRTFPAGIILAMSFERGQWTKAADGTVVVKDISGRTGEPLTAVMRRGTPGVAGKVGTGIAFPPKSRADLGLPVKATAGLKTFTFAFWVKTTESGKGSQYWTSPTLVGHRSDGGGSRDFGVMTRRGYISYFSGLYGRRDYNYQSSRVRINDGAWHHIALTNDGKTLLLYVDGKVVSPKGLPSGHSLTAMQVPLGASRYTGRDRYGSLNHSGTYDELQLYGRALTVAEIATIMRK